ncbi:MAG: folate family ECF transporter S component [Clostridia bacterium]|nr:folate family ECF transporter S component [Clostridia bacterium]MBR5743601.1 folate family ECF transporter S component [Clostridia bacterium]
MKNRTAIRKLCYAAILVAMDIVFARYLAIPLGYERLSLQFLPDGMAGILLGPVFGGLATLAADLLGMLIQSGGLSINPLISLAAILRGVIPGLILYKKEVTFKRALVSVGISLLAADVLITSTALHIFYYPEVPLWQIMGVRALVRIAYAPLQALILKLVTQGVRRFEKGGV